MKKENLLQANYKSKIFIFIFFNILVIVGIVYFVVLPSVNNLQDTKNIITNKKTELKTKSFQIEDVKKYFEERRSLEPRLSVLDNMLLNQDRSLSFINDLEQIAIKNNVEDKINLLQGKSEEIGLYNRIPIVFSVEGDIGDLMNYLVDLET